jgi:hypothetical protein
VAGRVGLAGVVYRYPNGGMNAYLGVWRHILQSGLPLEGKKGGTTEADERFRPCRAKALFFSVLERHGQVQYNNT